MPLVESSNAKSEVAKQKKRDPQGHFVTQTPVTPTSDQPTTIKDKLGNFLNKKDTFTHEDDDLIDVRVGNPLKRITELLQDIKNQKAFSFTLKGSLGIMGVFLTLSVFGIFGGGQILCDRGTQTMIGSVQILEIPETDSTSASWLDSLLQRVKPQTSHPRQVLVTRDDGVIHLPYADRVKLAQYENQQVLATGKYNNCARALSISDPAAVQYYAP